MFPVLRFVCTNTTSFTVSWKGCTHSTSDAEQHFLLARTDLVREMTHIAQAFLYPVPVVCQKSELEMTISAYTESLLKQKLFEWHRKLTWISTRSAKRCEYKRNYSTLAFWCECPTDPGNRFHETPFGEWNQILARISVEISSLCSFTKQKWFSIAVWAF